MKRPTPTSTAFRSRGVTIVKATTTTLLAAAITTIAGGATAATATEAVAATDDRSGARTPKSLVIGTDGLVFSRLQDADTPNIDRLIASGMLATSNLPAEPLAPTVSGPGWSTIATGTWSDKHRVVDNTFAGSDFAAYPDYLTRLETAAPDTSTLVVASWDPVAVSVFGPAVDERIGSDDAGTVATVTDRLANTDPDAVMVHLDEPDIAGHDYGAASDEYLAAIEGVDAAVGELLAAVEGRGTYADDDWLIVVTTDHGHTPSGGHGGNTEGERGVFLAATGSGIEPGSTRYDTKLVDIAPSLLTHHGVAIDPAWQLDGTPFGMLPVDPFDSLRDALRPAVDESAPADRLGWTQDGPDGWSIDSSRMPAGGVTEWRGWSFTTDEFWTNVDLGQGRETSVHNRDVFAVADSDEWDDAPHHAGPFDSTLHSPAYPLDGDGDVHLSFATNYQHDPTQQARVLASFDDGEPVEVAAYTASANRVEHLSVALPAGASSVRFGFAYTGSNGSFWTVDQVRVEQADDSGEPGTGGGSDGEGSDGEASADSDAKVLPATGPTLLPILVSAALLLTAGATAVGATTRRRHR
ncbi:alkaline phosphatase family protein [Plantibacter sp. Mn2098]|uniref:alkaline phosphatase family protein n=1 Tax=Plantibacter sp. Mn2098 TaxID=3395266 RepID=UPI003BDB64B2